MLGLTICNQYSFISMRFLRALAVTELDALRAAKAALEARLAAAKAAEHPRRRRQSWSALYTFHVA